MAWFLENLGTIVVALIVFGVCALIVRKIMKDKKSGKSPTCNCGCGGCGMKDICHDTKEKK